MTDIWIFSDYFLQFRSLSFYFHLICLSDVTEYFIVLIFKRQRNESPGYKIVKVNETIFAEKNVAWQLFIKNRPTESHKNPADYNDANTM